PLPSQPNLPRPRPARPTRPPLRLPPRPTAARRAPKRRPPGKIRDNKTHVLHGVARAWYTLARALQETVMAAKNGAIKLVAGNSNPKLAEAIAAYLHTTLAQATVRRFADMEIFVEIHEN